MGFPQLHKIEFNLALVTMLSYNFVANVKKITHCILKRRNQDH